MSPSRAIRISKFLHLLLFLVVASSALNYWYVANYAINGNWFIEYYKLTSYTSLVPSWQKLTKDGLAILLLIFSLVFRSTNPGLSLKKQHTLSLLYALFFALLGLSVARSAFLTTLPLNLILSTLRPFIFLTSIFVFCHRHLSIRHLRYVLEATNSLALIQVYYAIQQRQAAITHNGIDWLHSGSARSVGTLIEPNAMGLFLALIFYVNLSILPFNRLRLILLGSYAIGIFFTGSRTAQILVAMTLISHLYHRVQTKLKFLNDRVLLISIFGPSCLLLSIWVLGQVNSWSGRELNSSSSGGRFDILVSYVNQSEPIALLIGRYLSYGSNLVQTLSQTTQNSTSFFLSDSTWTSLLAQFGILGVITVIAIFFTLWKNPHKKLNVHQMRASDRYITLNDEHFGLLLYFALSSFTIILMEFYAVLPILIPLLFSGQITYPKNLAKV